jgi:peroxiredoxin Q/BCP
MLIRIWSRPMGCGVRSAYGKKYMGTSRVTYLIDEAGRVAAVFPRVKPEQHAEELLAVLQQATDPG